MITRNASAKDIFLEAIEWPAEKRTTFVSGACRGDEALRAHVDALLEAHVNAGEFLSNPTIGGLPSSESHVTPPEIWHDDRRSETPDAEPSGSMIGPYKLLQPIGEGGFGIVYMAQQQEPVRRKVALKLIKPGMDTRQVIARFEAERQALAMMEHPNIARVLDAGATEAGRPYFVMELVPGIAITEYCDKNSLSTGERVELFIRVCQAVQHAHQKGVIHRDLKPSNVLVTLHDGAPIPKIIDFGIAKATQHRLTQKTLFTEFRQFIGTPEYMSPEQAEMSELDVDTRTDIYSLGVLLYELLTGHTPFDPKKLRSAALGEIQRIIREVEPPRPSTRLSTIGDEVSSVARRRRTNPERLSHLLRGDLDWIVMKALEKDRTRRYESASEFALDVRRYLEDQPVLATPPSTLYRLRKFVQRHRAVVATGTVLAAVLVIGIVVSTTLAITTRNQWVRAERQTRIAEQINRFLNEDLLGQADPMVRTDPAHADRDLPLSAVLDKAAKEIDGRFDGEPLVEAAVRTTLGTTYKGLGRYDLAADQFDRAYRLRLAELGPHHVETMRSHREVADLYWSAQRFDDAEAIVGPLLERQRSSLGDDHPETVLSMESLSTVYKSQARYDEAYPLSGQVLDWRRANLGAQDPETLTAMNNLATLYKLRGEYRDAADLYAETLEQRRLVHGDEHLLTLSSESNLALAYQLLGRYEETEPLCRHVLDVRRRVLGPEHPATLAAINNLGYLYSQMERYQDTRPYYEEALEVRRRTLGNEHEHTLLSMNNLGFVYTRLGLYEHAEPLLLEMVEGTRRVLGDDHPDFFRSLGTLAGLYEAQGRLDEAEALYESRLDGFRRSLPVTHPDIGIGLTAYGRCLVKLGRFDEAGRALVQAEGLVRRALGPAHKRSLEVYEALVLLYEAIDRPEDAARYRALLSD